MKEAILLKFPYLNDYDRGWCHIKGKQNLKISSLRDQKVARILHATSQESISTPQMFGCRFLVKVHFPANIYPALPLHSETMLFGKWADTAAGSTRYGRSLKGRMVEHQENRRIHEKNIIEQENKLISFLGNKRKMPLISVLT